MIFITDELGKFEKNIIELAENVGFKECKTIEAIDLFCGISEKNDVLKEKDRYYAFIDIPQYWSVRADGLNGAIYDNKTKKANIYFKNPIEKRMVSRVEWIDRNNTVYKVDYYNKYGYMYCSENVSGGNVTVREFYDRNGDIKVLEQTGPKTYTTFGTRISPKSYRGFADYLEAYLKYNKIYDENIWLTSDEILNKFAWDYGNFKISYLPQNRLNSDLTVITQTNTAFRILCSEEQQVNWYKENSNYKCDRLYSYLENNKSKFGRKEAFIITESDQLEYIEQLINDFPEITFHIAASTIMSDKLTRLDINNNVELYPCITEQKRKELFERCDIYLDINHYRELYNAVNEAMVNNMIILAFDNTAHSKELYPMGNIFESSNYVKMKETLKNIITSQTIFNEYIDRQKKQLKQLAAKVVIGLWPYMLASMLAILIVAIMSLDNTRKLSPKKINIWTVTIMMIIAAVQAYHKTQTLMYRVSGDELIWNKIIVFIQLIAGMLIVVYMCDRATKYGIGGKVSVFMVNIVSGMMTMFTGKPLEKLALPVAIGVAEIAVMIVLETTEKRIAVQRVSINNIYADKNYIAYKLNPVGATPLMFASAAFLLPQFMCNGLHYLFPDNADIQWWMDNMRLTSPLGIVVYMVIICLLTIIFSMVMLSPGRTADDLLKSGDSIQDIYAGKSTKRYLIGTVLSFSVISSIIICICQGGPLFLQFGGYVDASLAMLPCSIMMTTGLWISLYREAEVYRNMDRYHTFI